MQSSLRRLATLAALAASAPQALAQSFQFTLAPQSSSTDLQSTVGMDLPGTAIGNYDAVSNPTGTQTRPGLFGGSGNQPITMDIGLLGDTNFVGGPSGTFAATIDVGAGIALISGVDVDLLSGASAGTDFTLNLNYQTFRTFSPNSLYIGGFTLPLPLGQVAVTNVHLVQTGPAVPGALTPTGTPDLYDFTALVPTSLSFDVDLLGTPSSVGPIPFPLPLVGTLNLAGGDAVFALSAAQAGSQTIPNPNPQPIEDIPLDLPTILPAGSVAHLLLDVTPGDLAFDYAANIDWIAQGSGVCETSPFCSSLPNTFSNGAHVGSSGPTSILLNSLQLNCDGVPPYHAGRFYFGTQQAFLPYGDGNLCVSGTRRRLPVVLADAQGVANYAVDFLDPLQPSSLIAAGSTWHFQFVYRDPLGGPMTFNTSDGVTITFCP